MKLRFDFNFLLAGTTFLLLGSIMLYGVMPLHFDLYHDILIMIVEFLVGALLVGAGMILILCLGIVNIRMWLEKP